MIDSRLQRKVAAKKFNDLRAERLAREKDVRENPEKYRCESRLSGRSLAFLAMAAAMQVNEG